MPMRMTIQQAKRIFLRVYEIFSYHFVLQYRDGNLRDFLSIAYLKIISNDNFKIFHLNPIIVLNMSSYLAAVA